MSNAKRLASWIRAELPETGHPLTHLKLQKLTFYCYGAALAFGCERDVGVDIQFEAWAYGPINLGLWHEYRARGSGTISQEALREHFRQKLAGPSVAYPEYLSMASSIVLDGIPVVGHPSLHDLARTMGGFARALSRSHHL